MKTIISTRPKTARRSSSDRPREDEDGLDVEHHEEQGKDVVADLALRPARADRVDAALIGDELLRFDVEAAAGADAEQEPDQNRRANHAKMATVR